MQRTRRLLWALTFAAVLGAGSLPADASSFARVGLDYLVSQNGLVVQGEVLSTRSYWNDPGTLILTDVQISVTEVLKGRWSNPEITVTIPGGTVGDDTIAVLGGAELKPGKPYVLFLQRGELPGIRGVYVVPDHSQGVFEIQSRQGGPRAVSQAVRLALVPDAFGNAETPGGAPGMPLQAMRRSVRELVERGGRREVKP
jgi:hypothetical protein